ncbi:hypothetical protein F4780DRAFT_345240 [Xylariomycetidae sp. FL0641]|nr:hypothetical protein F4780DRAFT_345240 [Xylariomycetidae sp. FL0641]
MRPNITLRFSLHDKDAPYIAARGRLWYSSSLKLAQATETPPYGGVECEETTFNCIVPFSGVHYEWATAPCVLKPVGGRFRGPSLESRWSSSDEAWQVNASIQLAFSTNMIRSDLNLDSTKYDGHRISPYNEWNSYEIAPSNFINASLCFSSFNVRRNSVQMITPGTLEEPVIDWSLTSLTHNTSRVREYLGVDGFVTSHENRRILNMSITGEPNDGPAGNLASRSVEFQGNEITIGDLSTASQELWIDLATTNFWVANDSTILCTDCSAFGQLVHPSHALLFGDIIKTTGRVADAVQSYMTETAMEVYSTFLNALRETQEVRISRTATVRVLGLLTGLGGAGAAPAQGRPRDRTYTNNPPIPSPIAGAIPSQTTNFPCKLLFMPPLFIYPFAYFITAAPVTFIFYRFFHYKVIAYIYIYRALSALYFTL